MFTAARHMVSRGQRLGQMGHGRLLTECGRPRWLCRFRFPREGRDRLAVSIVPVTPYPVVKGSLRAVELGNDAHRGLKAEVGLDDALVEVLLLVEGEGEGAVAVGSTPPRRRCMLLHTVGNCKIRGRAYAASRRSHGDDAAEEGEQG